MIRVTDTSTASGSLYGMELANSRLQQLQTQMSSGQQITKPSDNPAGTVQALQLRGAVKRNTQYATNANDAMAWMSTSDSTYTQLVQLAQKARTLVVQGLNSGSADSSSNDAIAQQLTTIRSSMLALANTQYNGRPIFGGNTSGGQAYDSSGQYVGDSGTVLRQVGDSTTVQVNQLGTQVFGDTSTGSDIFSLISNVAAALTPGSSTYGTLTSSALGQFDSAISQISSAQAQEGATYNEVEASQAAQTSTNLALTSELSNIQDIDIAQQAVLVSTANVNYQAALQTTASIRQESLLNFLNG